MSAEQTAAQAPQTEEQPAPGGYGSLGQLADRIWNEQGEDADGADIFEAFIEWAEGRGIELWPHQEDALLALMSGNHVILGTPTGSGKSMVALGMHFLALCRDQVSFYTAPIKALVSEKFFQLCEYFGRDFVGMITGDSSINPTAPIICCTAEILANRALAEGPSADISYAAMDEFHFYADVDRGWAWQVPLLELTNTGFLLMSATLGDTSAIAAHVEERSGRTVEVIANAPRPVPLSFEYTDTALEGTVELALREGDAPIYIVHFSQDAALNSAQALASYGVASKEQRAAIKDACKGTSFNTAFGKILQRLLGCGVGVHHAGMLPRYRLLVEKLAQEGLLPVICGTDTLGVGINVPIHTVLLTALTKFDGRKQRRLNAREFHQIAGRAGRSGFDTEGMVIALAPEHEIENAKLKAKAASDPKKLRKLKLKSAPENFVNWNQTSFQNLIDAVPEALKPRMRITHSMVLNMLERGGDARQRVEELISASHQDDAGKDKLRVRAEEIFTTLIDAGVVEVLQDEDGNPDYVTTVDMPRDFALDQPLSPFLLAALELLDQEDENYALDLVSMVESTLEQPRQILRAQERRARDKAMAQMKADGVDYDERLEKIQEVTYPKPLEELLEGAFNMYCEKVPWARDYEVNPKSILREMLETGDTFKSYVAAYGIARSEGLLLRYLSDAFRV
ncbi:MAG: DEAD/DEAH box helicase, partial [Coriobacteriales bacterium]